MKVGGNRVSTDEVAAGCAARRVAEAAVIAVEDPVWTTRLEAFVEPRPRTAVDSDALGTWLRGRQPAYKMPRGSTSSPRFPRTLRASSRCRR